MLLPSGAKSLLADELLAQQDLALLAILEFLCECSSAPPVHGLLFKPQEVRRRLLLLLEQMDFSKALHLRMVGPSGSSDQVVDQTRLRKRLKLCSSLPVPGPAEEAPGRRLPLSGGV